MRDYLEQHEVITKNHENHKENDRKNCVILELQISRTMFWEVICPSKINAYAHFQFSRHFDTSRPRHLHVAVVIITGVKFVRS